MKLGITEYIDCAHYLPSHDKCGRLHGHTYTMDVIIEGEKKGWNDCRFCRFKTNGEKHSCRIRSPFVK